MDEPWYRDLSQAEMRAVETFLSRKLGLFTAPNLARPKWVAVPDGEGMYSYVQIPIPPRFIGGQG